MKKDENNKLRLCELTAIKEQLEFECNMFIDHNIHCAYDEVIQLWERNCPGDYSHCLDINY